MKFHPIILLLSCFCPAVNILLSQSFLRKQDERMKFPYVRTRVSISKIGKKCKYKKLLPRRLFYPFILFVYFYV
ncbi:hypothetical protein SAMN05660330_01412 [Desulforhopalus singaporensis]|uniref:Uncharacterized protein n=1 Tax=Desulforhopalus singaporensis TaxID=91360 RepID=A0A1H0NS19_9BACT|nr:hypothetical protein SAMN05660330_01412 [Desulforhopalus singaporensis]